MHKVSRREMFSMAAGIGGLFVGGAAIPPAVRREPQVGDQLGCGWVLAEVSSTGRIGGFAFVSVGEGSPPAFVHAHRVSALGVDRLKRGQRVHVRVGMGSKGPLVEEMRLA